MVLGEESRRRM